MTAGEEWSAAVESAFDRPAEVARRIDLIQERLSRLGSGGVLLSTRRNFAWLSVGGSNHVVLASEIGAVPILVTRDGAIALAPNNEADRLADEELVGLPIEVIGLPWHEPEAIVTEAGRRAGGAGRGGLAADVDLEPWLQPVRSVLGVHERARVDWLGRRVRAAMMAALDTVGPGSTEDDAAARLVSALATDGIRAPVVLAAADQRIERYRHPLPKATQIDARLMLVAVAERWGLHVALTQFRELRPPSPVIARRLDLVSGILERMADATRPGATLGDVLATAIRAYADAGQPDEWRSHHQGGTIGYAPRERLAGPDDPTVIVPGMAFAWNPSIRGAKAEATFALGEDGGISVVTDA